MSVVGTTTVAKTNIDGSGGITKTTLSWTSDASGNVSGNSVPMHSGSIVVVEFVPGTGGTQPTDAYDISFLDPEGVNMFDDGSGTSVGANLSNSASSHKIPFIGGGSVTYVRQWLPGATNYQLTVANAGNAKTGTVTIYQSVNVL